MQPLRFQRLQRQAGGQLAAECQAAQLEGRPPSWRVGLTGPGAWLTPAARAVPGAPSSIRCPLKLEVSGGACASALDEHLSGCARLLPPALQMCLALGRLLDTDPETAQVHECKA